MISLTLPSGETGWLFLYPPEMSSGCSLRIKADMFDDRGATGRTARRQSDPTMTIELDWQSELMAGEVTAVRDALLIYQNEPIVVPCWPLAVAGTSYSFGTTPQGGYMLAWNESGGYQFFTGAVSSPSSWDWIAPAVFGYFLSRPTAKATQPDFVRYGFKFIEDSSAAWALGPFPSSPGASGPAIGSYTPPGFPFELNWAQSPEAGASGVVSSRDEIGPGRRSLQIFYPNLSERVVNGSLTALDPWPLICWWNAQGGPVQSQWVSTHLSAGLLTANAAAGASTINLSNQSGVAVGVVLSFAANGTLFYRKISGVSGSVVTLSSTLPVACSFESTVVCLAMLGRHVSDVLEISWSGPDYFSAKLDWVELREEYVIPAGETLGTTIGRKDGKPYLLEILSVQPVAEVLWRVTDWSTGVTLSDGRFFGYEPILIGERIKNIDLSDHALKMTLPFISGSPFSNFLPGQSFRRLFARLYKVSVASDGTVGTAEQEWYGEIIDCGYAGPKMEVQVSGPNRVFDRKIPGDAFGKTCNAHLFDSRCGVSKSAWTVTGSVVSTSGNSLVFGSASRPGGVMTPLQSSGALAFGSLQWGSGSAMKIIGIYASSYSGGNYTLTLREPTTISNGTTITIIPGCDLQWLGGCARYSGKFRGFPLIPARAPQFLIPAQATSSGKK